MRRLDKQLGLLLFTIGIASRLPFIEKMQSHWDGPQYSIGVLRYSLSAETPAPPGYPLYIAFGKVLYSFTHDPHTALLLVSVLFTGIGAAIVYFLGKTLYNRTVGIISSCIFLSGSSFYFFGITAYPYIIPAVTTASLALLVYYAMFKRKNVGLQLGILFSVSLGFRPQELFFIAPLFLFGLFFLDNKEKAKAVGGFVFTFLVWFVPFMSVVGGIDNYFRLSASFAQQGALPTFSFEYIKSSYFKIIQGLYFSFGIGVVFLIYFLVKLYGTLKKKKFGKIVADKYFLLFSFWILPSFLFNLFVRSEHAGYQMDYLVAFTILISFSIWKITKNNKFFLFVIVAVVMGYNLFTFFWNRDPDNRQPYRESSFHQSEVRKNDVRLSDQIQYIKNNFSPSSTLIITSPFPWRRIMYYLPSYLVYDVESLFTEDKQYKYVIRESQNWNFREYTNNNLIIAIPKNIITVVFTDGELNDWLRNPSKKTVSLRYNANIISISVKPGQEYLTGYHIFKKISP